jgi:anti-anti-sigma regulatory factor
VVPLGLWLRWSDRGTPGQGLRVWLDTEDERTIRVVIGGTALDGQLEPLVAAFRRAVQAGRDITLDVSGLDYFGMGFAGQVLMLEKALRRQGLNLGVAGATPSVSRALAWCGLGYLRSGRASY